MSESVDPTARAQKKKQAPPPEAHVPHDDHDDHEHGHHPFLAHHFDTPQQQFDAGKLGIWLFLVTEVLFFAGLFCAYTIYRAKNPEVFVYAHYHLDTNMGAINTTVLLLSSLTAAWAVRCAQLGQKRGLIVNIVITIACAATFMVVKYFEYSHKAHEGLLWGKNFNPHHEPWELPVFKEKHPEAAELAAKLKAQSKAGDVKAGGSAAPAPTAAASPTTPAAPTGAAPAATDTAAPTGEAPEGAAAPAEAATAAADTPEAAGTETGAAGAGTETGTGAARVDPPAAGQGEKPGATAKAPKPKTPGQPAAAAKPGATKPQPALAPKTAPAAGEAKAGSVGPERARPDGMQDAPADQAEAQQKRAETTGPGVPAATGAPGAAVVQDPPGMAIPVPDTDLGKIDEKAVKPLVDAGMLAPNSTEITRPRKAHIFFGIYFFMTGLHGVHVLIGIGVWIWMLVRATKGVFGENYFGPIDYTALYWHLVDLIWIYLFPLLYLIH